MMICNYLSFLIEETWVDWQDKIYYLGLFYFLYWQISICLAGYGPSKLFDTGLWDPTGRAFVLRCHQRAWILHGVHPFFGPDEWAGEPVFLTLSVAPQPLCTEGVGKGYNSSCFGCSFHVST